jgi:circadian clock protein KaiB
MVLRLHVAGEAPNSVKAQANLRQILKEHPEVSCELEVVDCLSDPMRSLEDGVLVTPTLIKLSPEPVVSIVGDLRNRSEVIRALGLEREDDETQ